MAKAKKPRRNRGRQPRISKDQINFLTSFQPQWEEARATKDKTIMSSFYDSVARKFLEKWPAVDLRTSTAARDPSSPQFVFEPTSSVIEPTGESSSSRSVLPPTSASTSAPPIETTASTTAGPTADPGDASVIDPTLELPQQTVSPTRDQATTPSVCRSQLSQKADQRAITRHVCSSYYSLTLFLSFLSVHHRLVSLPQQKSHEERCPGTHRIHS